MRRRRHVAIVGGGFSGAALAAHLLRNGSETLRVTLLEAGVRVGPGLAYGTTNPAHLLNTRAERMSLFADDPEHFVRWNRERGRPVAATDFVGRSSYGEYLEDALRTLAAATSPAALAILPGTQVADIEPLRHGFGLSLSGGALLHADELVLATGHPLPSDPLARWVPSDAPRYVRDPWRVDRLEAIGRNERVLLLGTGLTMVDVTLALSGRGHRGTITALSRRGLLPRLHGPAHEALPADLKDTLRCGIGTGNLRRMVRAVRTVSAAAEARGLHWQTVIDALRSNTERLWSALCAADRRRFVQRLRPYWEVHRHRLPPTTAARLAALQHDARLRILAGNVCAAAATDRKIAVSVQERGTTVTRTTQYDWIINCTGSSFTKQTSRALERRLLERGLLIADPLALGFVTTPEGGAFGAHGPVDGLHVLGPACRSQKWEHTAVPELREQARTLAAALLGQDQRTSPSLRQR